MRAALKFLIEVAMLSIAFYAVALWLQPVAMWEKILAGVCAFVAVLVVMVVLTPDEWR